VLRLAGLAAGSFDVSVFLISLKQILGHEHLHRW